MGVALRAIATPRTLTGTMCRSLNLSPLYTEKKVQRNYNDLPSGL